MGKMEWEIKRTISGKNAGKCDSRRIAIQYDLGKMECFKKELVD